MEAGAEVRGAEVEAGREVGAETPSAPQEGAPAAPAGEWMEVPARQAYEHLRSLGDGEALEIEVEHYGVVSRFLVVASHVRVGEERPLRAYTVFKWERRERDSRLWFPFSFKRKVGRRLEKGFWIHYCGWSEDQLRSFVLWLAGREPPDPARWGEVKIKARRYVLWVRP
jgi:hypothetical protein